MMKIAILGSTGSIGTQTLDIVREDQVWGFEYEGESRTVDMHIKTLRQKLGAAGSCIKTIRNVGYMIE